MKFDIYLLVGALIIILAYFWGKIDGRLYFGK